MEIPGTSELTQVITSMKEVYNSYSDLVTRVVST
jgi:hypothetical protein